MKCTFEGSNSPLEHLGLNPIISMSKQIHSRNTLPASDQYAQCRELRAEWAKVVGDP